MKDTSQFFSSHSLNHQETPAPPLPPEWASVLQEVTPNRYAQTQGSYVAYTDGCCLRNPGGPAGWGLILRYLPAGHEPEPGEPGAEEREYVGYIPLAPATSNNRAEIAALLAALYAVPEGVRLHVYTDSQYVLNVAQGTWTMKLNSDLWQLYRGLSATRQVTFTWVRGHFGNTLNERADHLSNLGAFGKDLQQCRRWEEEASRRKAPAKSAKPVPPVSDQPAGVSHLHRLQRLQALYETLPADDRRADSYARTFIQDVQQRLTSRPGYTLSEKQLEYLATLERRFHLI